MIYVVPQFIINGNNNIFILFDGSDSEVVLTKNLKRNYLSCEMHEGYYNMIIDRLQNNGVIKSEYKLKFNKKKKTRIEIYPSIFS